MARVLTGGLVSQPQGEAVGVAIANNLRSSAVEFSQGIRNASDGVSTLQIAESGMTNISQLLDRARTLAQQSANADFSGDRRELNDEFQRISHEIDLQAQATGLSTGGALNKRVEVFVGGNGLAGTTTLDLSEHAVDTRGLGLTKTEGGTQVRADISTQAGAAAAAAAADEATARLDSAQWAVEGGVNALANAAVTTQSVMSMRSSTAMGLLRTQVEAAGAAGEARSQVLQHASAAALAQANSAPQAVMALLR